MALCKVMFTNLLFLVLVLLTCNLRPWVSPVAELHTAIAAKAFFLYLFALLLIFLINRFTKISTSKRLWIANTILVSYLFFFYFHLQAHKIYMTENYSDAINAFLCLTLYFSALFFFHYTDPNAIGDNRRKRSLALQQVLFLLPFALPFLCFSIFSDLWLQFSTNPTESWKLILIALPLIFAFIALMPFFVVRIWQCKPLPDNALRKRLESICTSAQFTYNNLLDWGVMNRSLTAAIIGIIARFRYILFTKNLLHTLPEEQLEAILAHEIGHSKHHHLKIYPFIILGMTALLSLFFLLFGQAITHFFSLQQLYMPNPSAKTTLSIITLVPTAVCFILYFRFVFGYFSRMFERQADLYPLQVQLAPTQMIDALDSVAIFSGNTHNVPSWHHYSIQERINFLQKCRQNPEMILQHNRKVKRNVIGYFFLLSLVTVVLISAYATPIEHKSSHFLLKIAEKIDRSINKGKKELLTQALITKSGVVRSSTVESIIDNSLQRDEAQQVPGIAEYYAAQLLLQQQHTDSAALFMIQAWKRFAIPQADPQTVEDFIGVTEKILWDLPSNAIEKRLLQTMTERLFQRSQGEQHVHTRTKAAIPKKPRALPKRV